MLTQIIDLSLNNRFLVIVLVALMAIGGVISALSIPIDAVPDMTNVQVQVLTECPGLSPLEVERYVTYPVEQTLAGLPKFEELRSVSRFGVSVITVVFQEGTDIYRARTLVNERLAEARQRVSSKHGEPQLGVLSTALGEVLQFEVRGEGYTPMELRSILEWEIAPQLRLVHGVTEINSHGGYYKSYEVRPDPDRLVTQEVSLDELIQAVERNNASAGGGYIVHEKEQRFIRGQALLSSVADIEKAVVRAGGADAPILVRDVAEVAIAPLTRQGVVTRDGRGEVVTGMVMMLRGENSRTTVHYAKERLEEIRKTLPPGVEIEVIYDRAELIERTLDTVLHNLAEGGALVIIVLLVLLGSWRAGLIVALAIPLSMLFATNLMAATGITASLMSLGAIDFGLIVDSSVIMIENCIRRIAHRPAGKDHLTIIRDAALEVRKPTMFGELIIAIVYLPILTLQGTEGKLFRPMALTVLFALAGSLVLSLTLMPVLAYLALPRKLEEREPWLLRKFKQIYEPLLHIALSRPLVTTGIAVAALVLSVPVALRLGGEFMPRLDEGDVLIEAYRLPSSSLEDAVPLATQMEKMLLEFPEVKTVFCKTGRPEIATDVMGVHQTDVWVMLKPQHDWPQHKSREELVNRMAKVLNNQVPGVGFSFTQPIEMRVDELVAGVKADVAVLIYGDDLHKLSDLGKKIERLLKGIPGSADVKADFQANVPTLSVVARPDQMARYGVPGDDVLRVVSAAGGVRTGNVFEGKARYPIVVRLPEAWRLNDYRLGQVPVHQQGGLVLPLADLVDFVREETPPGIEHEQSRRRTFVQCNVRGRDVASFVHEAQETIAREVKLPTGYTLRWGGDFENLQSASLRLMVITPLVLLLIAILLYTTFNSGRLAALIFLAVPMAASGGVFALALREMPFSISAGVGFIALFGVAVLNGLVWVSGAEHARATGLDAHAAARETALVRIRPVLMTAAVASLGFLPMALSTASGAEMQRPLASVVIGGLVTSTLLTAFVVPAIYPWFAPKEVSPDAMLGGH